MFKHFILKKTIWWFLCICYLHIWLRHIPVFASIRITLRNTDGWLIYQVCSQSRKSYQKFFICLICTCESSNNLIHIKEHENFLWMARKLLPAILQSSDWIQLNIPNSRFLMKRQERNREQKVGSYVAFNWPSHNRIHKTKQRQALKASNIQSVLLLWALACSLAWSSSSTS